MKKSLAIIAAVGVASAASAQSVEIDPGASTVAPGEAVTLTVYADQGPADYAVAGFNFDVNASGGEWANNKTLIPASAAPPVALNPGTISGSSVTGISIGQLAPQLGFTPDPGRIAVWSADFSSGVEGNFDISTETSRFEVYSVDPGTVPIPEIRAVTPTEGSARVEVIPAPASLALLGLGGLAAARRRR